MAESKEELKSLLTRVKEESEKVGLKLSIQKTKIMASGPITSWEIDGETVETVSDFIFLGSKITADGDCSHEIKMKAQHEGALPPPCIVRKDPRRGEALFRCARPSGVPRGPATSTGSLASQRHPGKFPKVPGRRRGRS